MSKMSKFRFVGQLYGSMNMGLIGPFIFSNFIIPTKLLAQVTIKKSNFISQCSGIEPHENAWKCIFSKSDHRYNYGGGHFVYELHSNFYSQNVRGDATLFSKIWN